MIKGRGCPEIGCTETYAYCYNTANPHVTIHKIICGHIEKHGGKHNYGQGGWKYFAVEPDAEKYAEKISVEKNLQPKHCASCHKMNY